MFPMYVHVYNVQPFLFSASYHFFLFPDVTYPWWQFINALLPRKLVVLVIRRNRLFIYFSFFILSQFQKGNILSLEKSPLVYIFFDVWNKLAWWFVTLNSAPTYDIQEASKQIHTIHTWTLVFVESKYGIQRLSEWKFNVRIHHSYFFKVEVYA